MGNVRREIDAIENRISAHRVDVETLKECKLALLEIVNSTEIKDPRARIRAAELLMKHDFDVLQYEHPPAQKHEISGKDGDPIAITVNIKGFGGL